MAATIEADGSAPADAHPRVELDLSDDAARWRYTCGRGHRNWTPTNGGVWCQQCARQHDVEDPHWYELTDQKTGETVPWSAFDLE